jgi:single-strand DNA-binding protein
MNTVSIIGNLGRDPELRFTPSGKAVTALSLAVNDDFDADADPTWVTVVVWGKAAEAVASHKGKGDEVAVEGRLRSRTYDKDGQTHFLLEVVARRVKFLRNKAGATTNGNYQVGEGEEEPF